MVRAPDLQSANDDAATQVDVIRIVVVVEPAGSHGDEVAGLPALAGIQHADLVQLRAIEVIRMRIRRHVVAPGVTVDEQHPAAGRYGQVSRTDDTAAGNRYGVRVRGRIRRGRRIAVAAGERCDGEHPYSSAGPQPGFDHGSDSSSLRSDGR